MELTRPTAVNRAFWLLISSIVVSLFGSGAEYVKTTGIGVDTTAQAMQNFGLDPTQASRVSNALTVGSLVMIFLWNAFWLLLAFKIRAGRSWARITLTVLTTAGILVLLGGPSTSLIQQTSTTTTTSGTATTTIYLNNVGTAHPLMTEISWIISTMLAVASIVFIFRPAANPYIRRRR
jgi:hypothetical protein